MVAIVRETTEHHEAVRRLTIDAFADSAFGHNGEADLIEKIRGECADALSFVALEANVAIGHIFFSPATIRGDEKTHCGMGLGPMAVLPSCQRRGVGSMLVEYGLQQLSTFDVAFIAVAGHPEFYPRFGFVPATKLSLTHGFAGMPQDVLFIRTQDTHSQIQDGRLYYHAAFGAQHAGSLGSD